MFSIFSWCGVSSTCRSANLFRYSCKLGIACRDPVVPEHSFPCSVLSPLPRFLDFFWNLFTCYACEKAKLQDGEARMIPWARKVKCCEQQQNSARSGREKELCKDRCIYLLNTNHSDWFPLRHGCQTCHTRHSTLQRRQSHSAARLDDSQPFTKWQKKFEQRRFLVEHLNTWGSFFWTETILFRRLSAREFSFPNNILISVLSPQSSWRHPLALHAFLSILPCCVIDITSDTALVLLLPSTAIFIFSWFFTYFTKSFDDPSSSQQIVRISDPSIT